MSAPLQPVEAPSHVPLAVHVPAAPLPERAARPPVVPVAPVARPEAPAEALHESPLARLEHELSRRFGSPVQITITDNTRTMVSARHRRASSACAARRSCTPTADGDLRPLPQAPDARASRRCAPTWPISGPVRRRRTAACAVGDRRAPRPRRIFDSERALFERSIEAQSAGVAWVRAGARRRAVRSSSASSRPARDPRDPVLDARGYPASSSSTSSSES